MYMHAYEELRRREEVTYQKKKSVEQGYDTTMRKNIQIMCQKAEVEK